jgi:hypothetical protein
MNPNSHNSLNQPGSGPALVGPCNSATGEDTLRMIAALPVPDGLEERVHAALRSAPRQGRILAWPLSANAGWVRATAAAAIVMVVAGGGWGVYSHIQPSLATKAPAPARVGGAGGFSNADAKRSPQTLNPPVVSPAPKAAVTTQPQARKKIRKKAAAPAAQIPQK